ncbi:MAG TPA: feruloyl-CoA synthase [Polyangiaceae bacterium]|nr:feruloyl-CoA synthase [Polyangiaceae bacterium]
MQSLDRAENSMAGVRLAAVELEVTAGPDGASRWRSRRALGTTPRCVSDLLKRRAELHPERVFLAERAGSGWRTLTYAAAHDASVHIGAALLERGASAGRPVMILSENGIDHALLALGAMHVGVPAAPVSSAYALQSSDHARLRSVAAVLRPAAIFASSPARFARALDAMGPQDAFLVSSGSTDRGATPIEELQRAAVGAEASRAAAAVGPDTVAKILFTSGSTGEPSGIVNTQRMLTSNQEMIGAMWPFLEDTPPVTLDWLPWSHTFGGNHNFFLILRNGGTLYIDDGRAAPKLVDRTAENLLAVEPTVYFNVPRGFELLLPHLETNDAVRRAFFARLDVCFYAAAALPASTWRRLEKAAEREGRDVFFTTAWGSTETAPLSTSAHFPTRTPAVIGVPAPGVELKLAPVDGKLEIRVRGPHVTPGTWRAGGDIVPVRLDGDGFLPTGDAVTVADPARPEAGLVFDGRIGENFKLSSGTWVSTGRVRVAVVSALAPDVQDAVLTGHDRAELGALLFCPPPPDDGARLALRRRIEDKLAVYNAAHAGSSENIRRALLVFEPPSLDAGETTDKGYINQRRVLERRSSLVEAIYAPMPVADVLRLESPGLTAGPSSAPTRRRP